MNSSPSISVIMGVNNGATHLRDAVDSILSQTFSDFEFIILNDASTDETSHILGSYTDPRIKIITNEENIGLTKSLNKGLREARGEYVARMDADDISLPERFEIQKKYLDEHPEIAVVGTQTIIINSEGKESGSKQPVIDPELLKFYLLLKNQVTHSSVMFRKEDVMRNGGYDENIRYAQDYELWSRMLHAGYQFSNIPQPLLKYRFHGNSITQGATKGKAYESSQATVYKNIYHYIECSKEDFTIFIESLHQHKINSLHNVFVTRKMLKDFMNSYLTKEKVSEKNEHLIKEYMHKELTGTFRWYAMSRFGILYKTLAKIKKSI